MSGTIALRQRHALYPNSGCILRKSLTPPALSAFALCLDPRVSL
jgi:hypothetical protein